jgi:hypothetical protein
MRPAFEPGYEAQEALNHEHEREQHEAELEDEREFIAQELAFANEWSSAELEAKGPYPDDEVTAVDDTDATAYFDAADGGEGKGEDMEHDPDDTGFAQPLHKYPPMGLVSMRNAIDLELKSRRDALAKELAATEHALNGTKPRARRSDAGKPRAPKGEVAA